ncbi:MAG: dihydrodipicolinate synthase family protein [Candidatus Dormibacterales bacterium]
MGKYSRQEAKAYAKEELRGIFSAFCLPERSEGGVDEEGLRRDIGHYLDVVRASGLYVHGFYGNFWLLTSAERRRVLEIVVEEVRGRVPIVCRCAHQSPRETIELIRHAEGAGADFISLIGPSYASASEDMVLRYFEMMAAETELGISVFNTAQAGYVISPRLMARLAEIPNICALKNDVSMAHTIEVRKLVGDSIAVVDPSEENFLVNLVQFGQRAIYTGTNYMYDGRHGTPMRDYVEAALEGRFDRAAELYFKMQPLRDVHRRWVLEPWTRSGLCPIGTIKSWTEHLGLTGGPVRPPLQRLPESEARALRADLEGLGVVAASPVAHG